MDNVSAASNNPYFTHINHPYHDYNAADNYHNAYNHNPVSNHSTPGKHY
jgi:hypothetical protein